MMAMTSSPPAGAGSSWDGNSWNGNGNANGSPGGAPSPAAGDRSRTGFGLFGPRHQRHTLSVEQLDTLALPIGDDGVVVGVDADGQPAVLGVNRPTPYDMVLIGGLWTAQVLALRAAATGARVAVETGRAQAWAQLVQAVGGGQSGMTAPARRRAPS
ncbi:hypothetical protein ABT363_23490, partial [Streptomyces sp. NPDC000188]